MDQNREEIEKITLKQKKSGITEKLIHAPESYLIQWKSGLTFILKRDDLLLQETEAIVNSANDELWLGGGISGAIRREAGDSINKECDNIIKERGKPLDIGEVVYTSIGNMKNKNLKHIFHAAAPVYRGGKFGEDLQLFHAFYNSFMLAEKLKIQSISIPPISSGIFGYPNKEVAQIFYKALDRFVIESCKGDNYLKEIRMVIIDFPTYFTFTEEHNIALKIIKERFKDIIEKVDPDFSNIIDQVLHEKEKVPDEVSERITEEIKNIREWEESTHEK
jgi:O-acetyl-ADP-ribose deacetylase (regulator of RNase III)